MMYVFTYIDIFQIHMCIYTYIHIEYIHIQVYIHRFMHNYICMCVICVFMDIHAYIYMYFP